MDTEWGGANAEAYFTVDEVDAWLKRYKIFFDPWILAKPQQREAAVLQATLAIDSLNWHGGKYSVRQALEFPRVPPGSDSIAYGSRTPSADFPNIVERDDYLRRQKQQVLIALAEQAHDLLGREGEDEDQADQFRGLTSISRGSPFSESKSFGGFHLGLCPPALKALRRYRGTVRVVRGDAAGLPYG